MKFIRTFSTVLLFVSLLVAGTAAAADTSGLWLATVSVNKVGEVNSRVQDSLFDLGVSAVQSERKLIESGSSGWSYYDTGALGLNWQNSATFSGWLTGRAPLGYILNNGTYEAPSGGTKVSYGSDSANKNLTTYFRKTFTVSDKAGLALLRMRSWHNGTITLFLNGTAVETGAMSFLNPDGGYRELSIPAALVIDGENSIAVEVTLDGPASPDLSFDLTLTGIPTGPVDLISDKSSGWKYKADLSAGWPEAGSSGTSVFIKRKPLTIADFIANFQTKVTVPYDTDMRADFGDLRVYDATSKMLLPYWIESKTDSSTATVWFKTGSNNAVYLLFGNSAATSAANAAATFDFFDGFDGTAIDSTKWTLTNSTGFSVSGGVLKGTNTNGRLTSKATFSDGVVLEMKAKTTTKAGSGQTIGGFYLSAANNIGILNHPGSAYFRNDGGWIVSNTEIPANNMLYSLKVKNTTTVQLSILNLDTGVAFWSPSDMTNTVAVEPIVLGTRYDNWADVANQTYATDWDWIRVRKYAATEPTATPGAKEGEELSGWKSTVLSGTAWSTGAAPLGFNRGTTAIANANATYFRKTVSVTNPTRYSALNLRLLRDDGAVVYLNGREIMRSNMPPGTVTATTAPEQIIGPVEGGRYVTVTIPLATGDLVSGNNVFAVEIHQHPTELASATTLGALTRAGGEFPLRLLLHVDWAGTVRLLKEAVVMKDSATKNNVILADSSLASGYSGVVMRGDTLVGLRTSAIGYDFNSMTINCTGALGTSGSAECLFSLPSAAPTNPFLHRFHPDHDNMDERFTTALTGAAAEVYQVDRKFKLTFSNRYPANPDEPERPAASRPPGWGASLLGGIFSETLTGLHKETLSTSGWFSMTRISPTADLRQ